jgi:glycosyltransferase involved in cell wall biosynthesis
MTVSVVIPAYNSGSLMGDAIRSVVNQTYTDWELLVVDDGSSEDVSWVSDIDPRVRLFLAKHGGVSVARNLGVVHTDGDFVAFLDADDLWRPTKLQAQLDAMRPDVVFSYCAFDLIDGNGDFLGAGYGNEVSYLDMLSGNLGVLQSSLLVRRDAIEAVGMYSPNLFMQQDLDLFLRLSRYGPSAFVPSVEVDYRLHGGNASRNYWLAARELLLLYKLHEMRARKEGDDAALEAIETGRQRVRKTYAYQAVDAARQALSERQSTLMARDVLHALQLSPSALGRSTWSWISRSSSGRP